MNDFDKNEKTALRVVMVHSCEDHRGISATRHGAAIPYIRKYPNFNYGLDTKIAATLR